MKIKDSSTPCPFCSWKYPIIWTDSRGHDTLVCPHCARLWDSKDHVLKDANG